MNDAVACTLLVQKGPYGGRPLAVCVCVPCTDCARPCVYDLMDQVR